MMKVESQKRTLIAVLVVVAAAVLFWMLLLSPKMKEKDDLGTQVEGLEATLSQTQGELATAQTAKRQFSKNYRQLVILGKAVPASDDTASLLVQLDTVARKSHNGFDSIQVGTETGSASTGTETSATVGSASPTEAEAALLPLGATIGPAGLAVMPYNMVFTGSFFHMADFIQGIDGLVHTEKPGLVVDGRLMTINGFSFEESNSGFPNLQGSYSMTTYVIPPGQGLTAGASATAPAEGEVAAPVETTEGTPSASISEAK